jgi:hypothetical protein
MFWLWTAIATTLIGVFTCQAHAQTAGAPQLTRNTYEQVLANIGDEAAFDKFASSLGTITIGGQTKRTYFVLEGDLLLDKEQVRAAVAFQSAAPQPATVPSGELLLMVVNGQRIFWDKSHRSLSYAVKKTSFPSPEAYNTVVRNMTMASMAWESACPGCGLSFTYRPEFDLDGTSQDVTFIVEFDANVTAFIAASFFPNDPIYRRQLIISPSYFSTSFDPVGVLRHELGHVLGYRHEQIRGISGCFQEDNNWVPLTVYDPKSVMHYYCGGGGTMALSLSPSDIAAHRDLYQ